MRRAFLAVLTVGLLFFSASAWAQINLVRVTACGPQSFPASTCTIPSTGSGDLLVVAWASNNGGGSTIITSVTDNAGNTYSGVAGARAVDSGPNTMIDVWYAKNSRSGATVLTITPNPTGTTGTAVIWEFAGVDTTAPLDQTAVLNSRAATTTPSGAAVTTTSAAEAIISVANIQGSATGIVSGNPFTSDSTANGNGWAHLVTSSTGTYTAQWNNSVSGSYCASSVSFKAAGSSGGGSPCDLNKDATVNFVDVALATNMSIGLFPCTADIAGFGVCNVIVVQRVTNAAMGGTCVTGPDPHSVSLSWTHSTTPNVRYNLYRGTTPGGPYPTKVNSSPVDGTSYTDSNVQPGQYYYVARAVDINNNESDNSNEAPALVLPP
jgi:hypothetical protein